jgi:hypothetical protein
MHSQFIKYLNNITYNDPLESEINLLLCLNIIENSHLDNTSVINDIRNSKLTKCDKLKLYHHCILYHNYIMTKEDIECLKDLNKKNYLDKKSNITIKSKL